MKTPDVSFSMPLFRNEDVSASKDGRPNFEFRAYMSADRVLNQGVLHLRNT